MINFEYCKKQYFVTLSHLRRTHKIGFLHLQFIWEILILLECIARRNTGVLFNEEYVLSDPAIHSTKINTGNILNWVIYCTIQNEKLRRIHAEINQKTFLIYDNAMHFIIHMPYATAKNIPKGYKVHYKVIHMYALTFGVAQVLFAEFLFITC